MKNKLQNLLTHYKVIVGILLFDLIIIALHIVFAPEYDFFSLDRERNLPTMFQSLKLVLAAGTVFYLLVENWQNIKYRIVLGLNFFLFAWLAIDEAGEIHEYTESTLLEFFPNFVPSYIEFFSNLGYNSSTWVIFLLPVILVAIAVLIYSTHFFWKRDGSLPRSYILGVLFFASVIVIEALNSGGGLTAEMYNLSVILEEGAEMFGATFFIYFFFSRIRARQTQEHVRVE